jgi:hypothetical protein
MLSANLRVCGAGDASPSQLLATPLVEFPQSFEETLVDCLAERSAFIRAQRECLGDFSSGTRLKIPAEIGKHWVRAVMSTPSILRASDDANLVQYFKVCFRFCRSVLATGVV